MLKFLKNMNTMTELSLNDLTLKLVMLIALITGQRAQTMHLLDIRNRSVRELAHTYRIGRCCKAHAAR